MNILWPLELARDGMRNLSRHKLRSTLTLLGVVFGVAAVITMLGIGEGAQRSVLREIAALGLRNIIVDSVQPPVSSGAESTTHAVIATYGILERDVQQMKALGDNADVSTAHMVKQKVFSKSTRIDAKVLGVSPDYFALFQNRPHRGRLITAADERAAASVAVVTTQVEDALRAVGSGVGALIKIGSVYHRIVGSVEMPSRTGDRMIFLPKRTAVLAYGTTTVKRDSGSFEATRTEVGQVVVQAKTEESVPLVAVAARRILERNHTQTDFDMAVPLDILRSKQRTQRILNLVLLTIGAISLLVGGIGIMNIMLAIVTERIPEIGLRRAIGATRGDIMLQFLAETVTLSAIGGVLGCALGMVTVPIASHWTGWDGVVTANSVFASLAVALAVGLVFGLAPAFRAARMDPVDALRYE